MSISTEALADSLEAEEITLHIKCHEKNIRGLLRAMASHDEATRTRAQRTIRNLEHQLLGLRGALLIMDSGRKA
jgi:hypothetical protein